MINELGNDWTYIQHKKIDLRPTIQDFYKTVYDFMNFKSSQELNNINENDNEYKFKIKIPIPKFKNKL